MKERILYRPLQKKLTTAAEAALRIRSGMTVAFGGYTSSGYPKAVADELARRKASEPELCFRVISGSSNGPLDGLLAEHELCERRISLLGHRSMSAAVNAGKIAYVEEQMNRMPQLLRSGAYGKIDILVVEALGITEEGRLIPTSSVGLLPNLMDAAGEIIIEINTAQPEALRGMHDIYRVAPPPHRRPIPLERVGQRIGWDTIELDTSKVSAIVESAAPDIAVAAGKNDATVQKITDNLFNFLELEVRGRLGGWLPPIQTGFGNLASSIVNNFRESSFRDLQFFCGGINESCVELLSSGKVRAVSCGSIEMTPRVMELFKTEPELIRNTIVLRNGEITNCAEIISRLGIIALSSGIEVDIFGNVNSSHISGTKVVNGLGGGANFAENAGLSIVMIASEAKGGDISAIVPMVSHQDILCHDVDVLITENGVADLRGKTDAERAALVISRCAGSYRAQLQDYLDRAKAHGGHHPMLLQEALSWHQRLRETGSMKL